MRDPKKYLIKALIPAINAKVSGITVYTQLPKGDKSNPVSYPYIWISDIFQDEDGPKNQFMYNLDTLIQVVYENIDELTPLWDTADEIMQVVSNDVPFALEGGFEIMEATLINKTNDEQDTDTGKLNLELIRFNFEIQDNN